jgi:EAL domain-containing protein (putative c-di-GMP-specific phosphodiesterase class I)
MITDILAETGLPAHALDLEITETTAIENIAFTKAVLLHLQDLGVRISLDDFGTGYSSLNHLAQIPLNTIKIDRAFVKNLHQSTKDVGIVNAVVSLGHCLGLDVVAEGVEDTQTFELLRSLKCELIQGYLISPPLPVAEATVCLLENGLLSQKTSIPTPEFQEDQQAQLLASSTVNALQELSVHDPFKDVQDIQDFVVGDPMTR